MSCAHTRWDGRGVSNPLEGRLWLKPASGGGKCSKDLIWVVKCCATHIHTSKSLKPLSFLVTNLPMAGHDTEDFARKKRKVVRLGELTTPRRLRLHNIYHDSNS